MPSVTTTTGAPVWLLALCAVAMPFATHADPEQAAGAATVPTTTWIDAALRADQGAELAPTALDHPGSTVAARRLALNESAASTHCFAPDALALSAVLPVATDHGSHASGVVFAPGRVLTAAHAVQGASRFFVRIGEDFRQATLMSVDHDKDLAVLGIDTGDIRPLPLAGADLATSQPVWAVGFPRARGLEMSTGVFQRVADGAVHTSATIDSGQSGGGLLSCSGGQYAIAGMLRGYGAYRTNNGFVKVANHSVSVAARTIRNFLLVRP